MAENSSIASGALNASLPLAKRGDFKIGDATVRPSLRTVEGPTGSARGEPRVIQVLTALADAQGAVLSREDLLSLCWDGRIVGDDAINRAVGEVRRIAREVGAAFTVETVPRVGFRLAGIEWMAMPAVVAHAPAPASGWSRRTAIVAGATGVLALGAAGRLVWKSRRSADADALIERGRIVQATDQRADLAQAEALFRKAIAIEPERADAWGWLSCVLPDNTAARSAAVHALKLDPKEPNARAVMAFQRWKLDDWTQWEDDLLAILADAPDNALTLSQLTLFYQGMGRCKDSLAMNERAIRAEPFSPQHHMRRALKHWIFGHLTSADNVIEKAMELWPRNPMVWNARMSLYAYTDRAPAAFALLGDRSSRPVDLTPPAVASWQAALQAISSRDRADVARAVEVCTQTAKLSPGLAANAIMAFSYLGELGAAYRVADGLFAARGQIIQQNRSPSVRDMYSNPVWGRTQFLFIPATAALRDDQRFAELCERIGSLTYWRKRGIWPDPFVRGSIDPVKLA